MDERKEVTNGTLVGVMWKDREGLKLTDATTLGDLPKTLAAVTVEGGTVLGVRHIENPT